jgi:hypothetical protein
MVSTWRTMAAMFTIGGIYWFSTSGMNPLGYLFFKHFFNISTIIPIYNTETAIQFRLVEIRDILNGITSMLLALICLLVDIGNRLRERGQG